MKVGSPMTPGGHADSFATAIAIHLRPESGRDEKIVDPQSDPVDWDDPGLEFSHYSRTGVIGDPTQATAELGAALWQAVVLRIAEIFKTLAETPSTDIGL
jgi:creatinine amidohydrolase